MQNNYSTDLACAHGSALMVNVSFMPDKQWDAAAKLFRRAMETVLSSLWEPGGLFWVTLPAALKLSPVCQKPSAPFPSPLSQCQQKSTPNDGHLASAEAMQYWDDGKKNYYNEFGGSFSSPGLYVLSPGILSSMSSSPAILTYVPNPETGWWDCPRVVPKSSSPGHRRPQVLLHPGCLQQCISQRKDLNPDLP